MRGSSASFLKPNVTGVSFGNSDSSGVPVVEVTYVDDLAVLLAASSAQTLLLAIGILLKELVVVFAAFGLVINWGKGKTEAFLNLRGKGANIVRKRLYGSNGDVEGKIAVSDVVALRLVSQYKYLGSMFSADGAPGADVSLRISSATAAYAPIAKKVFGQVRFPQALRLNLAFTLVFSRLLFGVHVWSCIPLAAYLRLNAGYMKVLRQISAQSRYDANCKLDDLAVRKLLKKPSLQCVVSKARLKLLCSALINANAVMLALLGAQSRAGVRLPWLTLVLDDLHLFFVFHGATLASVGSPRDSMNLDKWFLYITNFQGEFLDLVRSFVLYEMDLDAALLTSRCEPRPPGTIDIVVPKFSCIACNAVFASARALATHTMAAHKQRSNLRCYLDASAICPICPVQFGSRIRCLAHVSERRKRGTSQALSCRERLELGEAPMLDSSLIAALDEIDRRLRFEARKSGRAQPLVLVKATRSLTRGCPDEPSRPKRKRALEERVLRSQIGSCNNASVTCQQSFPCDCFKKRRLFKKSKPELLLHVSTKSCSCSDSGTLVSQSVERSPD